VKLVPTAVHVNKPTIVVIIESDATPAGIAVGTARCNPKDKWDAALGAKIAFDRALAYHHECAARKLAGQPSRSVEGMGASRMQELAAYGRSQQLLTVPFGAR
jgi:hypothetical protein